MCVTYPMTSVGDRMEGKGHMPNQCILVALLYNKSHVVDVLKTWSYSEGLAKPATFV